MQGTLPPRVHGLVIEWAALYRNELPATGNGQWLNHP